MIQEYGGYLPLEFSYGGKDYFSKYDEADVVRLDCGRSAFWYALKVLNPQKVYVPYLNCINSTDPMDDLGIPYEYYRLNDDLTPKDIEPSDKEVVLWVNYYGNATVEQIRKVQKITENSHLLMDNVHAFYAKPVENAFNCYSARKFFGVPDGAYLIKKGIPKLELEQMTSARYIDFLVNCIEKGTNECYPEHLENEARLGKNPQKMSILTQRILKSIEYDKIFEKRKHNLLVLHNLLGDINEFCVNMESATQMYYPLLVSKEGLRKALVKRHIYTPTWWAHVPEYFKEEDVIEKKLAKYMLMIPIDQRYTEEDMVDIAKIIKEEYRNC